MQTEVCPKTKRLHLQGYVQFPKRIMKTRAIKLLAPNHVEIAEHPVKAYNYCIKDESRATEGYWSIKSDAVPSGQGHRSDLSFACELVKERGVRAVAQEKPETYVRFSTGLSRLALMLDPGKRHMPIEVHYIYGPPGVGKTRQVPDGAARVRIDKSGSLWYDSWLVS